SWRPIPQSRANLAADTARAPAVSADREPLSSPPATLQPAGSTQPHPAAALPFPSVPVTQPPEIPVGRTALRKSTHFRNAPSAVNSASFAPSAAGFATCGQTTADSLHDR